MSKKKIISDDEPLRPNEVLKKLRICIREKNYIFDPHATTQMQKRRILELTVLNVLKGKLQHGPEENEYSTRHQCWSYAVAGMVAGEEYKVAIGFTETGLLIITVY